MNQRRMSFWLFQISGIHHLEIFNNLQTKAIFGRLPFFLSCEKQIKKLKLNLFLEQHIFGALSTFWAIFSDKVKENYKPVSLYQGILYTNGKARTTSGPMKI